LIVFAAAISKIAYWPVPCRRYKRRAASRASNTKKSRAAGLHREYPNSTARDPWGGEATGIKSA
jgi:hypothetical protein